MFRVIRAKKWDDLRAVGQRMPNWVFRGQADSTWELETTFQRDANLYGLPEDLWAERERFILRQFQRRAHNFAARVPGEAEGVEWLALLRHYGGPVRLLDFSYSFYVAAFFATEAAKTDAAVWAINLDPLHDVENRLRGQLALAPRSVQRAEENAALVNGILGHDAIAPAVVPVEPLRIGPRLLEQQGIFLCPTRVELPFMENLAASLASGLGHIGDCDERRADEYNFSTINELSVAKIVIPRENHKHVQRDLRNMNITSSSLFGGLDGLGRSLRYHLRLRDVDNEKKDLLGY